MTKFLTYLPITVDEYGNIIIENGVIYGGEITPPTINASQNNYSPTGIESSILVRVSSSINTSITGLIAPTPKAAQQIYFFNVGNNNIILKNNDLASLPDNRFLIGSDRTLQSDEGIILIYDSTSSKWRGAGIII